MGSFDSGDFIRVVSLARFVGISIRGSLARSFVRSVIVYREVVIEVRYRTIVRFVSDFFRGGASMPSRVAAMRLKIEKDT